MKRLNLLMVLLLSQSLYAQTQFACPTHGTDQSREQMYAPMQYGTVWASGGDDSYSKIIFVDEEIEVMNDQGNLTPVGETFINPVSGQFEFRGSFKIGYDYSAKECRRQVVLTEQIAPGVWSGYTAIEICSPLIMKIFADAQAKNFDELWPNILALSTKFEQMSQKMIEDSQKQPVCDYNNKATYNYDECNELTASAYELQNKAYNLKSLEITDAKKDKVSYFKDSNGVLLPRFKVGLPQFYYQRNEMNVQKYNEQTEEYDSYTNNVCVMNVLHATEYAGLANTYAWDFSYDKAYSGQVWTYDAQGNSVQVPTVFKNDPDSMEFLDMDEYFYKTPSYNDR